MSTSNTVLVTTHDVELTQLLRADYKSYYLQESSDPDKLFDYKIREGHCTTRNAIKLLEAIGFPSDVIGAARKIACELEGQGGGVVAQCRC